MTTTEQADSTTKEGRNWTLIGVFALVVVFFGGIPAAMAASGYAPAVGGMLLLGAQILGLIALPLGVVVLLYSLFGRPRMRAVMIILSIAAIVVGLIVWSVFMADVFADDPNDELPLVAARVLL